MIVWRGFLSALIYPRGQGYMKILAEYTWSPTTTQSGSFLCTAASSTPIRVVTREVRYIHVLSLTLEHSMPISSPAAPGLTDPAKKVKHVVVPGKQDIIGVDGINDVEDYNQYNEMNLFTDLPQKMKII